MTTGFLSPSACFLSPPAITPPTHAARVRPASTNPSPRTHHAAVIVCTPFSSGEGPCADRQTARLRCHRRDRRARKSMKNKETTDGTDNTDKDKLILSLSVLSVPSVV